MNIIVETDIGRDPDDYLAILYLLSAGVNIKCITVSPGDEDQIAVVKFITSYFGLQIPVGAGQRNRAKQSCTPFHTKILEVFGYKLKEPPDGYGPDIIESVWNDNDEIELFSIGPLSSIGVWLSSNEGRFIKRAVMQGGFVGYDIYMPQRPIDKFMNKVGMSTFNLNGDLFGADQYLRANIENRLFIGKNVCHNVHYTPQIHERLLQRQRNKFMDLFLKSMDIYLAMHPGGKKLHDPTAAACLLHPEIGTWIRGKLIREKDQWRTLPDEGGDHMLVDLQYEELWDRLLSGR